MVNGDDKNPPSGERDVNAMLAGLDEANFLMSESPATVPMSVSEAEEAAAQSEDTAQLRRELHSARLELKTVVAQLDELEKVRSFSLKRSQEVSMLRARQVSLESEVDLAKELLREFRLKCEGLELELRSASADGDQLGLSDSDIEVANLRSQVEQLELDRDNARAELQQVQSASAELLESDGRAPLLTRIAELEGALSAADKGAGSSTGDVAQLEARCHALQTELYQAQESADEASNRADRLKVALERLRQAFVKSADKGEQLPALEAKVTELEQALAKAQAEGAGAALTAKIQELEGMLSTSRLRADALEKQLEAQASSNKDAERVAELEAQIVHMSAQLEAPHASADASGAGVALRKRIEVLETENESLERQLGEHVDQLAALHARGGQGQSDAHEEQVARLRLAMQRSAGQIQRLLLELEGSKSSVQRAQRDIKRHSRSVNSLHEAMHHLERYLIGVGPGAQQGVVLLQEVKRCAHDVRAMVESNERFGRSIGRVVERLGAIITGS